MDVEYSKHCDTCSDRRLQTRVILEMNLKMYEKRHTKHMNSARCVYEKREKKRIRLVTLQVYCNFKVKLKPSIETTSTLIQYV